MLPKTFRRALLVSTLIALPLSAQAADSRYGTWAPPGTTSSSSTGNTEDLLKDLKKLVDEAEQARAADRLFLRDLRDLMARYENPWTKRTVFDDFVDGELAKNPTWKTISGEFWVESGYGLRSKAAAGSSGSASSGQMSKEELAITILGAVLQGKNKSSTQTQTTTTPGEPAVLVTYASISNAFALNTEFSSWKDEGTFAYAVTQGSSGAGYRLVYTPKQSGKSAQLDLVRKTSRGEGVIMSHSIDALEDKKTHTLAWTRDKLGNMTVSLDGKQVMTGRDSGFRDPFDGAAIINAGADVIVKSVEVLGM